MIDLPAAERQIASLPYALALLGPGVKIAAVNSACEHLLGQGASRLVGRPIDAVIEFGEPRLTRMIADAEVQLNAREVTARIGRNAARRLNVIAGPVIGHPGWQTLTLIAATEVEALEGASGPVIEEDILRAPEILAHEIKNPLAGIRGAAQLLGRRAKGSDRALTELIAGEVDRIAALIDQMQPLSRRSIEPGRRLNPHEAIRRARAVLEAGAAGQLTIREDFDPSLPEIWATSDALMQVLLNLMTNAAEACREASAPCVTLTTRFASGIQLHAEGAQRPIRLPIELRVSDNGPGVDPAVREHIFEPFVTSKKKGQGLGLALVRKLVREMNGRITHDRDEAAGLTHFRLHLPVAEDAVDPAEQSGAHA